MDDESFLIDSKTTLGKPVSSEEEEHLTLVPQSGKNGPWKKKISGVATFPTDKLFLN